MLVILRYRMTFGEDGLFQRAATMGRTLDASMNTHAADASMNTHAAPLSAEQFKSQRLEDIVALVGEGAQRCAERGHGHLISLSVTKGSISAPLFNA